MNWLKTITLALLMFYELHPALSAEHPSTSEVVPRDNRET